MGIFPQLLVNALISGSIYALAAAGLALSYSLLKILNFSHGHMMMVGAYLFYWGSREHELGVGLSAICVVIGMVVVGLATLMLFIRPFLKYSALLPFVTTLSLATLFESSISMIFGVNVKTFSVGATVESIDLGGVYITPIQIGIIVTAIVLLSLLALIVHGTGVGRRVRSLAESPWAAEAIGINTKMVQASVFCVSTLFAALAGILVGFESDIQPTMGNIYTIKTFAAMTLGGLGSIWGTVIGSYLLGLVEHLTLGVEIGGMSIPAGYKDAFAFVVILGVLLLKPEGIFSSAKRKV